MESMNESGSCPRTINQTEIDDDEKIDQSNDIQYSEPCISLDCDGTFAQNMYLPRESIAWCGNPVTLKWPIEPYHMINRCQERRFAYAVVLYPDDKGQLSYLDGALGVALGLRKQGTNADLICLVTSDVKEEDIKILEIVYDRIITVPYITSSKKLINNEYSMEISPQIYRDCGWYKAIPDCRHPYCHVFTKLHILRLVNYDKVALVDLDIMPIRNYDSIFGIETPAGILEAPRSYFDNFSKPCHGHNLKLGDLIPHQYTDIDTKTGADINAGLWLFKPDIEEFNNIIDELQKPRREWFDKKGYKIQNSDGTYQYSYCFPEQNYLTKRWSGSWHLIDWGYATWQMDADLSFGIHMAGFEGKKPWMSQPVNYYIYNQEDKKKLPYVAYSIKEFNNVYLWTLQNYPLFRSILLRDLVFIGAYRTYVGKECNNISLNVQYPELTDKESLRWSELKEGMGNDEIRSMLAPEQRMIVDLLE